MNIEETKKAIEVMQAFVDGKVVQVAIQGRWSDIGPPNSMYWDFTRYNYRIKPEPKNIWVNEYEDGRCYVYGSCQDAGAVQQTSGIPHRTVHYREVIE